MPVKQVISAQENVMTSTKDRARSAPPPSEQVSITVKPVEGADSGVFEVTVQIDDQKPGSSVVRTSPREFAYQKG